MAAANQIQNETTVEGRPVELLLGDGRTLLQQLQDWADAQLGSREFVFLIPDGDARASVVTDGTPVSDAIGKKVHAVVSASLHIAVVKDVATLKKGLATLQEQFAGFKDKALAVENLTITGKITAQELQVNGATEISGVVTLSNATSLIARGNVECKGKLVAEGTTEIKSLVVGPDNNNQSRVPVPVAVINGLLDAAKATVNGDIGVTGKAKLGTVEVEETATFKKGVEVQSGGLKVTKCDIQVNEGSVNINGRARVLGGLEASNGIEIHSGNKDGWGLLIHSDNLAVARGTIKARDGVYHGDRRL
ncbi:hypothetical protein DFJ74DRAFT_657041 [Hyaloraphidium curvatum]|nr:hypothetical protein DFJ74DRAFT_657041 [Hyaloraphidium curvatum]